MSDYVGPDHTVTVTVDPCRHYDADAKTWTDAVHIDHDIKHPAACDALKYDEKCALDRWMSDFGAEDAGMPMKAGVYLVNYWGTGPDHNGEHHCGLDVAPVTEAVEAGAST